MDFHNCRKVLEKAGVVFSDGLSEAELCSAENRYGFRFPADLREYLAHALPTGNGFPNWRHPEDPQIVSAMAWPLEGMCFDIEHNAFWPKEWGERPSNLAEAFEVARRHVATAPKLIPIRGHRYLPSEPTEPGNPVFSVYQTDIIYYGANLQNYLHNEYHYYFGTPDYSVLPEIRTIAFWSWLEELNR